MEQKVAEYYSKRDKDDVVALTGKIIQCN